MLKIIDINSAIAIARSRGAVDRSILPDVECIVDDIRGRGIAAVQEHAVRLGDLQEGQPLIIDQSELQSARARVPVEQLDVLQRTADRIARFAEAQRKCITDLRLDVEGGTCGHDVIPLTRAGCYVPGGRYPLVSSMLMTAVTARAAGVREIWAATPRPNDTMLAAAALAGVNGLLACGGAQAIAALAYGAGPVPPCDIVCGPGNKWVTAAKYIVSRDVRIDMLAGPSELVIVADASARSDWIAADLLAQAEHDPDAWPVLITTDETLIDRVLHELEKQLKKLPTTVTARASLENGIAVHIRDICKASDLAVQLAPEHLQLSIQGAADRAHLFKSAGALFIGERSPEAIGDYGIGPNHTLPTGGTARFSSALSVLSFMRVPTYVGIDCAAGSRSIINDAIALARIEGMEAHARSLEARLD